jgi:hypothetical protein
MDWRNLAIGMGQAVSTTLPAVMRENREAEELGMRKEVFGMQKTKFDEDKRITGEIKGVWEKALLKTKTLTPQPGIGGVSQSPTMGVTETGAPGVDSGRGIELGQQPNPIPEVPQAPPVAPQTTQPQGEISKGSVSPARNADLLGVRSEALMETHDILMRENRIQEAMQIKKAELDNIFNIAKISPKMALQTWNNTPHLVQEYGEMDPASLKEDKDYVHAVVGDNLIVMNKGNGSFKVTKIEGGGKQPTPPMYVEKPIGPNMQQKVQYDPKTGGHTIPFGEPYRIHKPDKEGGDSKADAKEFRREIGGLDGLYKSRASIEKGFDPITGNIIPQTQIDDAKATIQGQIDSKEQWISSEYPDQWKTYRKPKAGAVGGKGKTYGDLYATVKQAGSSSAALKALVAQGYNEDTAKTIIKQAIQGGYTK